MITEEITQVNDVEQTNDQSRCLVCGEERYERFKLVLRQPLRGNAYGRIVETGSVCEKCAPELRLNARKEAEQ